MGSCLSKKKSSSSSHATPNAPSVLNSFSNAVSSTAEASSVAVPVLDPTTKSEPKPNLKKVESEEEPSAPPTAKKEVFLIKHRKSHDDRDRNLKPSPGPTSSDPETQSDNQQAAPVAYGSQVRTSSCTKEEVDAILIQCGRLSRSSSGKAATCSGSGRRYAGSKRSFDFDGEDGGGAAKNEIGEDEKRVRERERQQRRGRHSPSPQGRRRRTPSRERDGDNQRSSSRERRVSRSPGRRCPDTSDAAGNNSRPGKMVSVPATVPSSSTNGGDPASIKRISVKRNVGEVARTAASPRAQSPARAKSSPNEAQQQQQLGASLSRNSSRKAENSPFRRNPLGEIDPNSLAFPNRSQSRGKREPDGAEYQHNAPTQAQKPNTGSHRSNKTTTTINLNSAPKEPQATVETTVVISGDAKPQTLTRTRSARRSRDLDFNPEALLNTNPTPSYTRLLLEDIHNFHQKNSNTNAVAVTLPACLTKACSIMEAVADLNNNSSSSAAAASSNLSCTFSEDQYNKTYNNLGGPKDPFVESEIVGCDDLMEPSFHKYVTVRRGNGVGGGADTEDQESSGSNSFVCGSTSQLNNWGLSPSSWEPNSADSTDCWTSRSNTKDEERLSGRKRESYSSGGIGRGRLGSVKGLTHTTVVAATTATT